VAADRADPVGVGPRAMIAFGCMVSEPEAYRRYAQPGIRMAAEPDSEIYAFASVATTARGYNLLLEAAARRDDLEALVIVHPHTEILDPRFADKAREALRDPEVGIAGCAGASHVTGIAWWEGKVSCGHITQRYNEYGGGELAAYRWTGPERPPAEVDSVDGLVLVLSPWVVRNLRFDEGLLHGHGFDLDLCLQARAAGRRVVTFDAELVEHRSLDLYGDPELWIEGHIAVARKWGEWLHEPTDGEAAWRRRARRAEAEREAARTVAYFRKLANDARVEELQRRFDEATGTPAWRLTKPLRDVNLWRRSRAERQASAGR
jgi:GT2 family glycosyltransferase